MVRCRTPRYTKHSQKKQKKKDSKRKLSLPVLNNGKPKLALSCLIIYILFHLLKKPTSSIEDFETRNTIKFSCYKDYTASKGFGGTGEQQLYYDTMADPDLQIRGAGGWRSQDPEIRGEGPGLRKKFFPPLWASVWSKNKGGGLPRPLPQIRHCYIQSGRLTIALLQFPNMSFAQFVGTSKPL